MGLVCNCSFDLCLGLVGESLVVFILRDLAVTRGRITILGFQRRERSSSGVASSKVVERLLIFPFTCLICSLYLWLEVGGGREGNRDILEKRLR